MGAGRRLIESVALCVWQRHLRNVSTLPNRTPRRQIEAGFFYVQRFAAQVYFFALTPRSLSFMEMTRETPFSCCETP